MYKKNNARTTYKSNRRPSYKKSIGYQNYKARNKGNLSQQYNKYLKLAKEAFRSGDRVQSEYYYQFTDHFYRLMIELGMTVEENPLSEENKNSLIDEQSDEISNPNDSDNIKTENVSNETIESIPFIADPSSDKRTRSNK